MQGSELLIPHWNVYFQPRKRKKAARNRGTNLTIMLVNDYSKGLPIKKKKTQLQYDYLVKKVEMFRTMSAEQVQAKIKQQFCSACTMD